MKTVKDITYRLKDIEEKGYGVENNIIKGFDINIIAHFGKNSLQFAARLSFQRFTHGIHAEQEQRKTAQQRDYLENIGSHAVSPLKIL